MKIKLLLITVFSVILAGCNSTDADIAKHNSAKAADNFEVTRRVVFYNTWTDTIVQQVEGRCSIDYGSRVSLICKTGYDQYKRSFISLSGQVTVFVEQMEASKLNVYHYRRTFKPQALIPDIDFRGGAGSLIDAVTPDSND